MFKGFNSNTNFYTYEYYIISKKSLTLFEKTYYQLKP